MVLLKMVESKYKSISILVPAFNEEKTIGATLDILLSLDLPLKKEITVFNDASTDKTPQILKKYQDKPEITIIHSRSNVGKTQAIRKSLKQSTGDLVVIQDADMEFDPHDLLKLLAPFLKDQELDVVYGNRFHPGNINKGQHYWGNLFLAFVSNLFTRRYGFKVKDVEVGYKMAKGDLFRSIGKTLESTRFGLEPELTAKFAKTRPKLKIVDITYTPHINQKERLKDPIRIKTFKDGFKTIKEIIKYNIGK